MKLSIAMIVRDEENNIRRALDSVLPIADEIVILDTGSVDNTKAIITAYEDPKIKLSDHPWKNDFSEARNASIGQCTGDWIMILDADEELTPEARSELRAQLEALPGTAHTVMMVGRNFVTDHTFDTMSQPRVFRTGTIRYEHAIHNQPRFAKDIFRSELIINHYGYMWTPELLDKKRKRSMPLIEEILKTELPPIERLYYKCQLYKMQFTFEHDTSYITAKEILDELRTAKEMPYIVYEVMILAGFQAIQRREFEFATDYIDVAKLIYEDVPDAYLIESLMHHTTGDHLKAVRAFHTYYDKYARLDRAAYNCSIQCDKYVDIVRLVIAASFVAVGLPDMAVEEFNLVKKSAMITEFLDNFVLYLSKHVDDKLLKRFMPHLLEIADGEQVNLSPLYSRLKKTGIELGSKRKKIAILYKPGLGTFLDGIRQGLSKEYLVETIQVANLDHFKDRVEDADLVWYEFGNELAIEGTKRFDKKSIVRVHGYEVINGLVQDIYHPNVSRYLFVADHVRNMVNIPEIADKVSIIRNGVNTSKYTFAEHQHGRKIAFVGNFNTKKNPGLAIQILHELVNVGRGDYELHWAGDMQDVRLYAYTMNLVHAMELQDRFFIHPHVDTNEFLEDKDYFLSTSIHEGYGMAILEAMSKGIKPIIHNFYIADEFYPMQYVFNSIPRAVEMIKDEPYDSTEYRQFAERHSETKQLEKISELVREV
ncbi:MAG TPA: glycosyltransferase, partial [Thermotogota bacterium]|nr:glycosyltransferase [Thermotogota bacterium]HQN23170.1 glycosyltransferase [Thermotogota bacterium]